MKFLFSSKSLIVFFALLALVVVWTLWGAAMKLLWFAVFAFVAFIVIKTRITGKGRAR